MKIKLLFNISFLLTILFFSDKLVAQASIKDSSITVTTLNFNYAYQIPKGDLQERFSSNHNIGFDFRVKLKSNWVLGLGGNFIFGGHVKETSIIKNYIDSRGGIIGQSGTYSNFNLSQRGFSFQATFGKVFPVIGPNRNSGIQVLIGMGYLEHKILLKEETGDAPVLKGDYARGIDRYTNGLLLTQFIGYRYFSNKRLLNFYIGLELTQGFTKNRRPINFDEGKKDDKNRVDILFGPRIGFSIPIYKKPPKEFYYN